MQLEYDRERTLFIFRFGCLVFFNFTEEERQQEIHRLKAAIGESLPNPTTETYEIRVTDQANHVEYEHIELKKLNSDYLRLIAMCVGQSASLEYFENQTSVMLHDTASLIENLKTHGKLPFYTKRLLRVIGSTASTRQYILSSLEILDPPEETWKSKELEKIYKELSQNFDIEIRFRSLDRKLTLLQDNIEIITDLVSTRKTNLLEGLIVCLIILELLLAILKFQ